MTEVAGIKGTALDTRIKNSILTDPVLQADLTAEEFRAWVNLTVWVVSLVSDGAFNGYQAELLVPHLDRATLRQRTNPTPPWWRSNFAPNMGSHKRTQIARNGR